MIEGDKPPAALGDYPGFLMSWIAARGRDRFAAALEELGLRLHEFAALSVIAAHPGQAQQELVGDTGIDPSTMVSIVDSLEKAGLAERRMHETDRRKRAIHLTDEGQAVLVRAQRAAATVGAETFAPLSAAERKQLHGLLRRVAGLD